MGICPKGLFKRYVSTKIYPRKSLHKKMRVVRKVGMAGSTALTAVDGAVSMAKEAASHGGCKDSGDKGDKLLQLW